MENEKCFICMEPKDEAELVHLCKCRESAICLDPCFTKYIKGYMYDIEKNIVKYSLTCPICKKNLNYQTGLQVDWKTTKRLLTNYFLTIWFPFICYIWPNVYLYCVETVFSENNEMAGNIAKGLEVFIILITPNISLNFYKLLLETITNKHFTKKT